MTDSTIQDTLLGDGSRVIGSSLRGCVVGSCTYVDHGCDIQVGWEGGGGRGWTRGVCFGLKGRDAPLLWGRAPPSTTAATFRGAFGSTARGRRGRGRVAPALHAPAAGHAGL
jgi:hypothetical protein